MPGNDKAPFFRSKRPIQGFKKDKGQRHQQSFEQVGSSRVESFCQSCGSPKASLETKSNDFATLQKKYLNSSIECVLCPKGEEDFKHLFL